jgi:hypothetical protein
MPDENPFLNFSDADLSATLVRAVRNIAIAAAIGLPIIWIASGWQSAVYFIVGAAISAGGVYESRRLIRVVNAKLDKQRSPRSTGFVIAMFLLRLFIAGGVLYVTLKFLDGAVYAIIAGLALAMLALMIEAVRLTRS